jgi:hypothetical protein
MNRLVLAILAAVVLPPALRADAELEELLKQPISPAVRLARITKEGKVALKSWMTHWLELKGGRVAPQVAEEDEVFDLRELKVRDIAGKELDRKQLPKLLERERPVLVVCDGPGRIDPVFLKVIKEGTLILVIPEPKALPSVPPATPPGAPPSSAHGGTRGR